MDDFMEFDPGPLTWVKGEIDNAFAAVVSTLEAWNGEDTTPLKTAAAHLHQVNGALQIVDLQGVSRVCAEAERLLADLQEGAVAARREAAEKVIEAAATLQRYLDALMNGAPNAELALMPVYTALVAARGQDAPPPSELFFPDVGARVKRESAELPLDEAARSKALRSARGKYQKGLLGLLQNKDVAAGLTQMDEAIREVEQLAPSSAQYTFWWSVGGLTEAMRHGELEADLWLKRLCGRIDMQMRRLMEGSTQLADRLLRDVLYHLAQDVSGAGRAQQARELFALEHYLPASNAAALLGAVGAAGQPAQTSALREAVAQALEQWLRVCGGRPDALESVRGLARQIQEGAAAGADAPASPPVGELAQVINSIAVEIDGARSVVENEALQLEMAVALLLVRYAIEQPDEFDLGAALALQGQRLQAAIDPEIDITALESTFLLEQLASQAQDKLLRSQVTQDILSNLHQVEETLEKFFRNPDERSGLPMTPGLMKQIQGGCNLLGLDVAANLIDASLEQIAQFATPGNPIEAEELDWIADAISTLGLYIEAVRRGRNDPAALHALLVRSGHAGETAASETSVEQDTQATLQALVEAARAQLAAGAAEDAVAALGEGLKKLQRDADLTGDSALRNRLDTALHMLDIPGIGAQTAAESALQSLAGSAAADAGRAEAARLAAASAAEIDAELLEIFLEEAREVIAQAEQDCTMLAANLSDAEAFVGLRRGFHTLKGSGRMVGLTSLGEVAWEIEQTLNQWLRDERTPDAAMLAYLQTAVDNFKTWVEALATRSGVSVDMDALVDQARALRASAATPPPASTRVAEDASLPKPDAGMSAQVAPGDDIPAALDSVTQAEGPEEAVVQIGEHHVPATLFGLFKDEAAQLLDTLDARLQQMRAPHADSVAAEFGRAAHTLAGISRTTGFSPLAALAARLETWADALPEANPPLPFDLAHDVLDLIQEGRDMLELIVSGQFPEALPDLDRRLQESGPELVLPPASTPTRAAAQPEMVADALDPNLLPIFLAESTDILPRIGEGLRQWRADPGDSAARLGLQRTLHTLKGSARMVGALHLGEVTHAVEARIIEHGDAAPDAAFLDALEADYDTLSDLVSRLRSPAAGEVARVGAASAKVAEGPGFSLAGKAAALDTLINEAGEISIARTRVENVLGHYKHTAQELTANVERLRGQLREMEIQAESRMAVQLADKDSRDFDPLEFDRFTRLQELTRLMAESVNDVATAQDNLLAGLNTAEGALTQQARMTRNLQQTLMGIRMVPLDALAERLHRLVRQTARELGRKAVLHIEGGDTELDRIVLDRVTAPLEHLLRNAVAHGIETPEARRAVSKPETGQITLRAAQEGNELLLTLQDDGAGIQLDKVRRRAEALGELAPGAEIGQDKLEAFLFQPGFSTVDAVSQVAGRGVGLDVVKSEVAGIGGRIKLDSETGQGTRFTLRLPLTLAVNPVVLALAGTRVFALPANIVVLVKEVRLDDWPALLEAGEVQFDDAVYPLRSLPELTGQAPRPQEGKYRTVLILRSGHDRIALHVDGLAGNLEAVVKNIGPQLARIPGIAGATVLGDGRVALILNPFALLERTPAQTNVASTEVVPEQATLILIVDDSLTVRKITGRLLNRQGYRVATAKDGVEALEFLQDEQPAVMLLDIEMPRMDGFEVARHVRADARTRNLPIIMITSRSAEKHREHALELGVNAYMGKPYQEDELLAEIARLCDIATPLPV